jgi:CRISPR-associated protein Csy2
MQAIRITINVSGAGAKNASIVYGHPTPFTFIGFAHAFCLKHQLRQSTGVLAVFHWYQDRARHTYGPIAYNMLRSADRDSKEGGKNSGTQLDIPRADMRVSIIFGVDGDIKTIKKDDILNTVATMRFSGGVIQRASVGIEADMASAIHKCPSGFAMLPYDFPDGCTDPLGYLIDVVAVRTKDQGSEGWITPCLRGFHLMEEPTARPGSRGGYAHAFADPLVGAVQFQSIRGLDAWQKALWEITHDNNLILFTTAKQEE